MYWLGSLFLWSTVALQSCILALMARKKILRRFRFLTAYLIYIVCKTVVEAIFLSHQRIYFYVFWATQPAEMVLAILAVHESFMHVFRGFYGLLWFRLFFPAAILLTLAYSAWSAFAHPPLHVSRLGAAIISSAVASEYVIVGIAVLFFAMVGILHVRWRLYEFRIVFGFGISALAMVFAGVLRSQNGTRFNFVSEFLPPMAYLLANLLWLSAMFGKESPSTDCLAESPDHMVQELNGHLAAIKQFLRQ